MISILLLILKIIGLILLAVLGLLLLLILIILFVPVRYTAYISKTESINESILIKAKVTYLLHFINIHFDFPSDDKLKIRIGIIKIWPRNKKNKEKKDHKENKEKIPNSESSSNANEDSRIDNKKETITDNIDEKIDIKSYNNVKEKNLDKNNSDKVSLFTRINNKLNQIENKYNDISDNIEYYINVINSDSFINAFNLCKDSVIKLIKVILPKKIKGTIEFGSDDPEIVGKVYAIYSVFYPKIGKKFKLYPFFDKKILTVDLVIKGKITIFKAIFIALKVFFNKNIRKVLKMFKKENINGRK